MLFIFPAICVFSSVTVPSSFAVSGVTTSEVWSLAFIFSSSILLFSTLIELEFLNLSSSADKGIP